MINLKIYNPLISPLVFALVLAVNFAFAQPGFVRNVEKEFPITVSGDVYLNNSYGQIDVKTWDKNEVQVKIEIRVFTNDKRRAKQTLDNISIDFHNESDFVKVETKFHNQNCGSSEEFSIDYEVFMPINNRLNLKNKHGDIFIAELNNDIDISIQYGDYRIVGSNKDVALTVGYGDGTIGKARNANVTLKYGKMKLDDAGNVDLNSRYSKIFIGNASEIRSYSKYDTFDIGKVKDLNNEGKYDNFKIDFVESVLINSKYTDIYINTLVNTGEFDLRYGGVEINDLHEGFSKININGEYVDFIIGIGKDASYKLDFKSKYSNVRFPKSFIKTYEKKQGSRHEFTGYCSDENATAIILARIQYGGLKLKLK